jgi:CelD/BcsL family acetyltransferase involved in cellulose biosynthesis
VASEAEGLSVRTARSFNELEGLREEWLSLRWSRIETDPEFFRIVTESRPEVVSPHVTVVERDGRAVAMAVGRLEDVPLEFRLGYKVLAAPRLRTITLVNGGVSEGADEEAVTALLGSLVACLRAGEADLLRLAKLGLDSSLRARVLRTAPPGCLLRFGSPTVHWRVGIPESFEAFLAERSWNTRRNLRKHTRRFERDHEGRFTLGSVETKEDAGRLLKDMVELNARSYKHGLGTGLVDDEEHRRLVELGAGRDSFRASVLYVDGEPASFWCGFKHGGGFFSWLTAYDPVLARHNVGTYVLVELLEELCADSEIAFVDWGFGDADYKRSLGDKSWLEDDVLLFAPRLKTRLLNGAYSGFLALDRGARALLGDSRLVRGLKRRWRRRLSGG